MRRSLFGVPINDDATFEIAPGVEVDVAYSGYYVEGVITDEPSSFGRRRARSDRSWAMVKQTKTYEDGEVESLNYEALREHIFPRGALRAVYGAEPQD